MSLVSRLLSFVEGVSIGLDSLFAKSKQFDLARTHLSTTAMFFHPSSVD
jgi:hypothetical protein